MGYPHSWMVYNMKSNFSGFGGTPIISGTPYFLVLIGSTKDSAVSDLFRLPIVVLHSTLLGIQHGKGTSPTGAVVQNLAIAVLDYWRMLVTVALVKI